MKTKAIPFYTQAGLAAKVGVVRSAVFKAIERGSLPTVETLDGVRVVARSDAEKWLKARANGSRKLRQQ